MNQSTQATNTRLQSPLGRLREKPLHIRAMFLYVTCTLIMTTGTVAGIQLALPAIMEEFDVPVTTAVWVSIAYFVVIPGVTVAIGGITTFFEQRGLAVMGLVVDLLLMAAVFFTHNIYLFIVIRFLSSAFRIFPWLILQVVAIGGYPPEHRGRAVGYSSLVTGIGMLVSPATDRLRPRSHNLTVAVHGNGGCLRPADPRRLPAPAENATTSGRHAQAE